MFFSRSWSMVTIVSPRLVGIKEWMKHGGQTRALVLCYEAAAYTGTLTSSAEGENRWMTRAEIAAHPRGKSLLDFLPIYDNPDVTSMTRPTATAGRRFTANTSYRLHIRVLSSP